MAFLTAKQDTFENRLTQVLEPFILWIDQNLAHEFGRPDDLARGYDVLSRADVFLGRVRRRQSYGLWSYARELMSSGVAVARRAGRAADSSSFRTT